MLLTLYDMLLVFRLTI